MRVPRTKTGRDPTIALINVVFLMLIFFLIAGTVAAPISGDLKLIKTTDLNGAAPPDGLVIHEDGSLEANGETVMNAAAFVASLAAEDRGEVRIIPDRDLPAGDLLRIGAAIKEAGAQKVIIATEKVTE